MRSWWYRLLENSDLRQARRAAWITGGLIIVLLYTLGGLSLYVRKTMLSPTVASTPTATTVSIIAPTAQQTVTAAAPTQQASATPSPTATLYPTLTPDLAN